VEDRHRGSLALAQGVEGVAGVDWHQRRHLKRSYQIRLGTFGLGHELPTRLLALDWDR